MAHLAGSLLRTGAKGPMSLPVTSGSLPNASFDDALSGFFILYDGGCTERCVRGDAQEGGVPSAMREMM
jgi:uncharacterized metal-binding protein